MCIAAHTAVRMAGCIVMRIAVRIAVRVAACTVARIAADTAVAMAVRNVVISELGEVRSSTF